MHCAVLPSSPSVSVHWDMLYSVTLTVLGTIMRKPQVSDEQLPSSAWLRHQCTKNNMRQFIFKNLLGTSPFKEASKTHIWRLPNASFGNLLELHSESCGSLLEMPNETFGSLLELPNETKSNKKVLHDLIFTSTIPSCSPLGSKFF